jgi:hypothetical protein
MSIPFSIAGLVFNSIFFTYTSWIFIGIQLALVLFGFFFKFAFQSVVDIKVSTSGIWKAIGKAGSIASILGLLLAILMIVAPQYFGQVVYQCVDGTLEKSIDSCPNVESYLIQLAKEQSYNLSKSL